MISSRFRYHLHMFGPAYVVLFAMFALGFLAGRGYQYLAHPPITVVERDYAKPEGSRRPPREP